MSPPRNAWREYEPGGPIDVEGGIRARSKRGAIGEQWWSRRFIAVLDSYGMASRLARGRSYARRGQVIDFKLTAGTVTARVQGSRPAPYRVTLRVRPLTAGQWRAVEARLGAAALFRARLLAGEMPAEIEAVFASSGAPLFPQTARDLEMNCTCPDWGVPCKHVAAVCYVLAEAFDDDPFALLAWRGRERAELLAALRGQRAGASGDGQRAAGSGGRGRAAPAGRGPAASGGRGLAGSGGRGPGSGGRGPGSGGRGPGSGPGQAADPGSARPDSPALTVLGDVAGEAADFWTPGLSPARLRSLPQSPAAPPDLLLRLSVPPDIEVRGRPLADLLRPVYEQLAAEGEPLAE